MFLPDTQRLSWQIREGRLTLNIVLSISILRLIVMYHLHDLQQIVLSKLGERFGQLLHVDVLVRLLALLLRLSATCCAVDGFVRGSGLFKDLEELIFRVTEGLITATYMLAHLASFFPRNSN